MTNAMVQMKYVEAGEWGRNNDEDVCRCLNDSKRTETTVCCT